ncbi:MAG: Wadjet anti-phage system protein JetD domain-containing protein [Bacteroidota bacterium]
MNFLSLPDLWATAGLFGSGFQAGNLRAATWLQDTELPYWGDLDTHGLQIVNQLRGTFPTCKLF